MENETINEQLETENDSVSQPIEPIQSEQPMKEQPKEQPNAYASIIEQQNEQIAALIAQNQSLTGQITQLIQSGAQINTMQQTQPQPMMQPSMLQPSLSENDDWSIESLAREMAKDK